MNTLTLTSDANHETEDRAERSSKVVKNRVQFDLPPRSMDRLNALKVKTEAASYAEVVKNALRLYEALIEETEQGRTFLIRDENGAIAPFRMFV
jgi:hypothetical protein